MSFKLSVVRTNLNPSFLIFCLTPSTLENPCVSFEKTRQLDRGIKVESTSYDIKKAIADALNESIWIVFPDIREVILSRVKSGMSKVPALSL